VLVVPIHKRNILQYLTLFRGAHHFMPFAHNLIGPQKAIAHDTPLDHAENKNKYPLHILGMGASGNDMPGGLSKKMQHNIGLGLDQIGHV
jgi:hypothetical protein